MLFIVFVGVVFILAVILLLYYSFLLRRERKELKKLIDNYDETEDFSKQGERKFGSFYGGVVKREPSFERLNKLERRDVLPSATSAEPAENSKRSRGIFRKLRR